VLLQNLTLLTNDTVVVVTNVAAREREIPAPRTIPVMASAVPTGPSIVTPILPPARMSVSPQDSTQIIVSTGKPGSMASPMVYSGEPTINGLEAARRAAQEAAQRAQLETSLLTSTAGSTAAATQAYAEAAALGRDGV